MQRRVVPKDFESVGALIAFEQKTKSSWRVYKKYELHKGVIRARPTTSKGRYELRFYQPLDDVPDLFLRFARLHKESDFSKAALSWSCKYGLPGGDILGNFSSAASMELSLFQAEAKRAWAILNMYEAVLNRDAQRVRDLAGADLHSDEILGFFVERLHEGRSDKECLSAALSESVDSVDFAVEVLCRPQLYVPGLSSDSSEVRSKWEFANLLGAMYLQMYQVMISSGKLSQCKYCGRIISYAPPIPGSATSRKPRKDKEFCDSRCRQNYHYHNRIKPGR